MAKQKSQRTAFIRVSAVNNTQQGLVEYTFEDLKKTLEDWTKGKKFKYYLREHNGEVGDENRHFHIVCDFNSPTPFTDIKAKFPYGDIETCRSVKQCVQYLVHMNDLSKKQYDFSTITTNDPNVNKYAIRSYANTQILLSDYITDIEQGKIREYNLTEHIPIDIFAKNKTQIINALEFYRRKVMTNKDRDIQVMIFTGDTGTYKTTYAKNYAKSLHKSICISSSSNDPMQDYMGEDILVLDDIRDSTFKFHDLLKVLDNHTKSSVQSRYSNKAFIGDTIIITSSLPISEWYFNLQKEDKEQLYRRIPIQMQFTKDEIKSFEYNEYAHKYVFIGSVPNINNFKPKDLKHTTLDVLKAMGVEMTEDTQKKFVNAFDQLDQDKTVAQLGFLEDDTIEF